MLRLFFLFCLLMSFTSYGQVSTKVQIGSAQSLTDVDPTLDPLNAGQISVLYDFTHHLSFSAAIGFYTVNGTDLFTWSSAANGGGLVEDYYMPEIAYSWNPSFSSQVLNFNVGGLYRYELIEDRLTFQLGAGVGIAHTNTYVNLLNQREELYQLSAGVPVTLEYLDRLYDGTFETRVEDLGSLQFNLPITGGLEVALNENLSLCADYTRYLFFTDYLDGIKNRTISEVTGGNDGLQFFSLGLKMKFIKYDDEDWEDD